MSTTLMVDQEKALYCAQHNDLAKLKGIISRGGPNFDVNYIGKDGKGLIHYAIHPSKNLDMVRFLVEECKCNLELKSKKSGSSPLMVALSINEHDLIQFLIKSGADVNSTNNKGVMCKDFIKFKPSERSTSILSEVADIPIFDINEICSFPTEFERQMRTIGFCLLKFGRDNLLEMLHKQADLFFQKSREEQLAEQKQDGSLRVEHKQDQEAPNGKVIVSYRKPLNGEKAALLTPLESSLKATFSVLQQTAHHAVRALAEGATSNPHALDNIFVPTDSNFDLSDDNIQVFFYLPGNEKVSAATHYDLNALTIVVFDYRTNALQVLCPDSESISWVPAEQISKERGCHAVIFPGATLHYATSGYLAALLHRVLGSKTTFRNSVVFKLKSPPSAVLDPIRFTKMVQTKHHLTEQKWLPKITSTHWAAAGITEEMLSEHPFLGLNITNIPKTLTYKEFSPKCGEWYEHGKRFGEIVPKFVSTQEQLQANAVKQANEEKNTNFNELPSKLIKKQHSAFVALVLEDTY